MLAIIKKKLQKSECYTTCSEVCMTAFIQAIVKQDLTGLIKAGSPTPDQLQMAWETIFDEYLTLSGDTKIKQILSLQKDVVVLANKIKIIEFVVAQLRAGYHQRFADQLKSLGFRFQYNNGPDLGKELDITLVQTKALQVQLNQSLAEIEELKPKESEAATEMDYDIELTELSKFQGYTIDPDKITVTRYCAIVKRFKIQNAPTPKTS